MSNLYYGAQHHSAVPAHPGSHGHHGGRSRRTPRFSGSNNNKVRAVRAAKDVAEAQVALAFRKDFELARSFDIEDDELFCPFNLLTDDDLQSIHSSGSDRSSLSSGSPEQSPLQHQLQPTPSFTLSSASSSYTPSNFLQASISTTKIHQPLAQRARNAIPIVDPSTRSVASPPPSVSPARQMQQQIYQQRRW